MKRERSKRAGGRGRPVPAGLGPGFVAASEARLRDRVRQLRLPRYAELPPFLFLKDLLEDFPAAGDGLARLAAYDADAKVRDDAKILIFTAAASPAMGADRRARILRTAVPVLQSALHDPAVDDAVKYEFGPLLMACGVELSPEEYQKCFKDFEAVARRRFEEAVQTISPNAEELEQALAARSLVSRDGTATPSEDDFKTAFGFALKVSEHNPEAGGRLLCVTAAIAAEHGRAGEDAEAALVLAGQTRAPGAAWCIADLAAWPALGALGDRARATADDLRAAGVAPALHLYRDFSHALVTHVDGAGSRSVTVFHRTPQGGMDALSLLLNEEVGIKDVWCVFDDGTAVEEELRSKDDEVLYALVPLKTARELAGHALAAHAERKRPPPGRLLLHRPALGNDPIEPRRRTPNIGAYAVEIMKRGPELADGSDGLAWADGWETLWCATDEAYEWVRRHGPKRPRVRKSPADVPRVLAERFAREVAVRDRARLLSRMALNLELEAWAGRAGRPINRTAARTWVVISEEIVPFHAVPFALELAVHSIRSIADNLAQGFRNQQEANEASLKAP